MKNEILSRYYEQQKEILKESKGKIKFRLIKRFVTPKQDKYIKYLISEMNKDKNIDILDDMFQRLFFINFSDLESTTYEQMKITLKKYNMLYRIRHSDKPEKSEKKWRPKRHKPYPKPRRKRHP